MRKAVYTEVETFTPCDASRDKAYVFIKNGTPFFLKMCGGEYVWITVESVTAPRGTGNPCDTASEAVRYVVEMGHEVYEFNNKLEMFKYIHEEL